MIDNDRFRRSHQSRETKTSGVTLAAFYDDTKPPNLLDLIERVQTDLTRCLRDYPSLARPYRHWSHATLCGMEGHFDANGDIITESIRKRSKNTGEPIYPLAIAGFLDFVRGFAWPMQFQFGGYHPDEANPYDDESKPYDRSFAIRPDALAVLMGWPLGTDGQPFAPYLYEFRQALHPFGIAHKYHYSREAMDNDLFMVIADLIHDQWQQLSTEEQQDSCEKLEIFQKAMRTSLQSRPITISLNLNQIWLIKYFRTTLEQVEFAKPINEVSVDEVHDLYHTKPQ
jgi:hypothetical protein